MKDNDTDKTRRRHGDRRSTVERFLAWLAVPELEPPLRAETAADGSAPPALFPADPRQSRIGPKPRVHLLIRS